MCIAIIKSIGIKRPSWDTLETCFTSNPDGAGYAYSPNGKYFIIVKGLQTYEAFKASIEALESAKGEDFFTKVPAFFHFRIGTHGSKDSPEHTHPFPLTNNVQSMEKLLCRTTRIVMHNGILSGYGSSKYGAVQAANNLSDTMDFIANFMHPLQKMLGEKTFYESKEAQLLVSKQIDSSRVVVMEPDGRSIRWGDWKEHEGCWYSNGGFEKKAPISYTSGRSYNIGSYNSYLNDSDLDYWGRTTAISRFYVDVPVGQRDNKEAFDAALKKRFIYPVKARGYQSLSGGSVALDPKYWYYADFATKKLYVTQAGAFYAEYEDSFQSLWEKPPIEKKKREKRKELTEA